MCVLIFSISFIWNISYSKKNRPRYDHTCVFAFKQNTHHFCPILIKFKFPLHILEKYSKTKFHENPFEWEPSCSMRTVRRTDVFRHCPNARKNKLNLPSFFDTIHNKISLCILTTDLQSIHFLCSLSLQRRLFIAMPYSTVFVIRCFFMLYSKTRVSIPYLLPSVSYILYYMIGVQLLLQLHFVPHGENTPSVVLCTWCLMFNCIFDLSAYFTQNTSTTHLS